MRTFTALLVALALAVCSLPRAQGVEMPVRILFVGNSLTYVGNLPAVLDALSAKNGHVSSSDMIVTGGATLTDWVKSGVVSSALRTNKYSFVVLQERGGDFKCGFGPEVCVNSRKSLAALAEQVRHYGAKPVLLGTYQPSVEGSKQIEETEGMAARALRMEYVPVSERLRHARASHSDLTWFAPDGMHPGKDLTALEALVLYQALYATRPAAVGFSVDAPIYTSRSGLKPELRSASAAAPIGDTPFGTSYDAVRIAAVMRGLW